MCRIVKKADKFNKSRHVHEICGGESDCVQEMSSLFIDSISSNSQDHETMGCKDTFVNDELINCKLDTRAETNILPFYLFNNLKLYENANLYSTNMV